MVELKELVARLRFSANIETFRFKLEEIITSCENGIKTEENALTRIAADSVVLIALHTEQLGTYKYSLFKANMLLMLCAQIPEDERYWWNEDRVYLIKIWN